MYLEPRYRLHNSFKVMFVQGDKYFGLTSRLGVEYAECQIEIVASHSGLKTASTLRPDDEVDCLCRFYNTMFLHCG